MKPEDSERLEELVKEAPLRERELALLRNERAMQEAQGRDTMLQAFKEGYNGTTQLLDHWEGPEGTDLDLSPSAWEKYQQGLAVLLGRSRYESVSEQADYIRAQNTKGSRREALELIVRSIGAGDDLRIALNRATPPKKNPLSKENRSREDSERYAERLRIYKSVARKGAAKGLLTPRLTKGSIWFLLGAIGAILSTAGLPLILGLVAISFYAYRLFQILLIVIPVAIIAIIFLILTGRITLPGTPQ